MTADTTIKVGDLVVSPRRNRRAQTHGIVIEMDESSLVWGTDFIVSVLWHGWTLPRPALASSLRKVNA